MPKKTAPFYSDLLVNDLDCGFFRHNLDEKRLLNFANQSFCELLGYSPKEMSQVSFSNIFKNKRICEKLINQVIGGESVRRKKVVFKAKNGNEIPAECCLAAVYGRDGNPRYIEGLAKPIMPSSIQKDLADSKELFKTVFHNSPVAIIVADKDERIIAWNPFTEKLLGFGRGDLFNRPVSELYPKKEWKRIRTLNIRKHKLVSDLETRITKKDQSALDIRLSLSVVRDQNGEVLGSIGIMHDTSIQKRTEKMLMEAKKAAESASEAKTMFLANMSHEVRTPMNTIMGMVDLTLDTELTPEQRDYLQTVKNAADILLSLLNDILDLSRVEAGKIQLEDIEISIDRTIRSVCKTMDILAKNKGLSLQWLTDEKVPDLVKGDPVRLRQVLVNLINNAIKFTSKGKIEVEVKVTSISEEKCLLLFSVKDEGIGIEKDKQEKIFEVFTQEDVSTTRQFGGTGLGLAICKKLLELMGGSIWVESEKGRGSKFYFNIPFQIVRKDEVPEALQEDSIELQLMEQISIKKSHEAVVKKENIHILLAEDNMVNQRMTQRMLEKKGWQVTVANQGQEVLDLLMKQSFDLILMDAQMPVIDGWEATKQIRESEKTTGGHIPIIALTARVMAGDRKKCLDAGMDGYVSKPIDRSQLFEVVESFFFIEKGGSDGHESH
ncbi:MAG: ATP-binding protein [Candidatus Omnitrophota bacterium]